ncbi:hypothetical protein SAMN05444266_104506 [Chitinophaga jiangningensis]|uniref:Uncharacterized protein n=1 Tax=Chitinophaga jiangningensis TaxID=1419482 RepID=A0A1M7CWP4_9BACT|nr:hypothetical protein [Chitinophaga jiangningensis]SHL71620.1 hypothetical protein SAMN05444266_104506 [Chitinophaga jiangningensis]
MITVTLLSLSYIAAISFRIKDIKAPVARLLTWNFHLIFLVLSVISIILSINGYGFKGTQTERMFLTLYAGSGFILYGLSKPEINARYYYLASLFAFPVVLVVGLLLPFLRTITILASLTLFADSDFERFKIDDDFAMQTKSTGILTRYPTYSMVEDKYWFFEKITPDIINPGAAPGTVKLSKLGNDSVHIQLTAGGTKGGTIRVDTIVPLRQGYIN